MNAWQVAALVVACWFSACACLLCGWMALVTLARRTAPRRPGYIRPSLRAYVEPRAGTAAGRAIYTGCSTAGPRLGEPAAPKTQPEPNRTTAHGGFTNVTESSPGAHTTDADGRYPPFPNIGGA